MITALNPDGVLANPFYSQGIALSDAQRLVFISGQVGVDADGVLANGIAAQTERAIGNVHAVLAEAGLSPSDLVKLTIYLTDPANVEGFVPPPERHCRPPRRRRPCFSSGWPRPRCWSRSTQSPRDNQLAHHGSVTIGDIGLNSA